MKSKNLDLKRVWKQFEDHLVPRLRLNIVDRAVWSHLFRHSHLEGKGRLRFSIACLGRGTRLCDGPVRAAVRRLVEKGALRLIERSKAGHMVEVRLPEEVRAVGPPNMEAANETVMVRAANIEELDFLKTKALRQAIHAREHGLCFYCQQRMSASKKCLDHVVALVNLGRNSYRNLVSCCVECNSRKGKSSGADFLLWLYRERRLTASELTGRLRALEALAAGKLPPPVLHPDTPIGRKGRPPGSPCRGAALLRPS